MFDLTGKTALVTGASGGIGGAIAKGLAAQGARVALSGTRVEALEAVKAEIGGDHPIVACNLSDGAAVDALVGQAEAALGGTLNILVANAGITKDGLLLRMKDEDFEKVLKINLESYFRLSRAALKTMMKNRWGRIIGITSVVGVTGNPGQANYAASKAGMIGFTKAMAAEVASRNVTANTIAPGFIASAMTDVLAEAQKTALLAKIPAGRLGQGADIAAAAVYLASEEAAYVTGQTLHVNGGMAMI
ncbi:3-oxoacyl-[acyl-carrier-protein] reductase [Terricaulis sp.]|uniref:3-oxoacyl-[acyl-carrier-protein] reductase n=1 Tax=Terricaulis sp. TaxID=2768686 RepID=UPI0037848B3E